MCPNNRTLSFSKFKVINIVAMNVYILWITGVWFMHCHLERHLSWGMETVFIVKNGKSSNETLAPPPPDMPPCWRVFWTSPENDKKRVMHCLILPYATRWLVIGTRKKNEVLPSFVFIKINGLLLLGHFLISFFLFFFGLSINMWDFNFYLYTMPFFCQLFIKYLIFIH